MLSKEDHCWFPFLAEAVKFFSSPKKAGFCAATDFLGFDERSNSTGSSGFVNDSGSAEVNDCVVGGATEITHDKYIDRYVSTCDLN